MPALRSRLRRVPARGFTFVELLLVVMVLGVMAGVATPRYQAAVAGIELEAAAKRLVCDLRHARQQAIERGVSLGLTFSPENDSYSSLVISGEHVADPDHPSSPLEVRYERGSQVAIVSADFSGAQDVQFNFRGDPSAAGSVELTNGSASVTVQVNLAGNVERNP